MNEIDRQIVNSYQKGETPKAVKINVSNNNGKATVKDGTVKLREDISNTRRN